MSRYFDYAYQLWLDAQDYDESEWVYIFTPEEIKAINGARAACHQNLATDIQEHPELYE